MDYVERARELAPALEACADQIDRERRLPESMVAQLHESGLFRLLLPRSVGGAEMEPAAFVRVIREIGRADASTGWVLCQTAGSSLASAYLAPEVARKIFGQPKTVFTWGPPAEARAVECDGGYRVTGQWPFASGIHHATWLGAHCPIYEAGGQPRLRPDGMPVMRSMIFPASEASIADVWHVVGLRGTGSDAYTLSDVFVPRERSISRDDPAERREPGPLYRFTHQQVFEIGFAGLALGIARGTMDAFVALARGKTPRGLGRTVRDSAVTQSQVAQAEGQLRAADAFLLATIEEVWDEVAGSDAAWLTQVEKQLQAGIINDTFRSPAKVTLDQRMRLRLASSHAFKEARSLVDAVYYLSGSTEVFSSSPIGRRFRDMHAVTQQLQARQDHFERVGQYLLGLEPDTAFL